MASANSKKVKQTGPRLGSWSILLYGLPKIGKTEQIAKLPNPLILNCEPMGVDSLRGTFDRWDIADLAEFASDAASIALEPNPVIVIDGITTMINAACIKELKNFGSGMESQKAYKKVIDTLTPGLHALLRAGKIIGATGHARTIPDPEGEKKPDGTVKPGAKVEVRPDVNPEMGNDLFSLFSIIGYCFIPREGGRAKVLTKTSDNANRRILAGDRFGVLPETMPLDMELILKTLRESTTQPPAPAPAAEKEGASK